MFEVGSVSDETVDLILSRVSLVVTKNFINLWRKPVKVRSEIFFFEVGWVEVGSVDWAEASNGIFDTTGSSSCVMRCSNYGCFRRCFLWNKLREVSLLQCCGCVQFEFLVALKSEFLEELCLEFFGICGTSAVWNVLGVGKESSGLAIFLKWSSEAVE
jgi:hypothetical protein